MTFYFQVDIVKYSEYYDEVQFSTTGINLNRAIETFLGNFSMLTPRNQLDQNKEYCGTFNWTFSSTYVDHRHIHKSRKL